MIERYHHKHHKDIGETRGVRMDWGGIYVVLERCIGVYGYRDTRSYCVRFWRCQ